MIFRQIIHDDLGCASYLIGDEDAGVAAVDPRFDIEEYLELARQILDVREQQERNTGHIPGSAFTPSHDITTLPDGLNPERPIAVICGSGHRAATAASLVQYHGAQHVLHIVDGGVPKWERLGHPLHTTD